MLSHLYMTIRSIINITRIMFFLLRADIETGIGRFWWAAECSDMPRCCMAQRHFVQPFVQRDLSNVTCPSQSRFATCSEPIKKLVSPEGRYRRRVAGRSVGRQSGVVVVKMASLPGYQRVPSCDILGTSRVIGLGDLAL